jgi:hypothetical protein
MLFLRLIAAYPMPATAGFEAWAAAGVTKNLDPRGS